MEQLPRSQAPSSCPLLHHHHHHPLCHYVLHHRQHHHHCHHHYHCRLHPHHHPTFTPDLQHNRKFVDSYLLQKEAKLDADTVEETAEIVEQVLSKPEPESGAEAEQEQEQDGLGGEEESDEEDPIFVLTDEWKEFFAKSEAKRKLGSSSFFPTPIAILLNPNVPDSDDNATSNMC